MNSTQVLILCILVYFAITNKSKDTRNVLLLVAGLLLFCMMDLKEGWDQTSKGWRRRQDCDNVDTLVTNALYPPAPDDPYDAPQCYKFQPVQGKHYTIDVAAPTPPATTTDPLWKPKILLSKGSGIAEHVIKQTTFQRDGVEEGGMRLVRAIWSADDESTSNPGNDLMNIRVVDEDLLEKTQT